ncbi:MAG: RNA polymerase sigma factor, partial [Rhodospirillales bacterium]|nr:RNA polymerase sigma factor [Rhodospirillales bacterium]
YDDRQIAAVTVRQGLRLLAIEAREIIALVDIAGFS